MLIGKSPLLMGKRWKDPCFMGKIHSFDWVIFKLTVCLREGKQKVTNRLAKSKANFRPSLDHLALLQISFIGLGCWLYPHLLLMINPILQKTNSKNSWWLSHPGTYDSYAEIPAASHWKNIMYGIYNPMYDHLYLIKGHIVQQQSVGLTKPASPEDPNTSPCGP